jgi:hypothetical protein
MSHAFLADLVVLAHLAFILFCALGGLFALRWPRVAWLHLPALAWGVGIELSGGVCPLTPLENRLRASAGGAGYAGGFIEHHLMPVIYPPGLTREAQLWLAAALALANAALYLAVWRRRRSARAPTA